MCHPDRHDDVRPAVEDRAVALPVLHGARGPVSGRLLVQPGVAAAAASGPRVEVGLAVGDLDRLEGAAGDGPTARRAPDELLDVPGPPLPFVVADAEGNDPRLRGRGREEGRGQQRGARERRADRAAHRGSFEHVCFHPPRWTGLEAGSAPGSRGLAEPARGRSWVLDHLLWVGHRVTYRRTRSPGPGSPAPRAL